MSTFVTPTSIKKKKIALLLCIFGGFFGLHQYYVGKIGKGLIYTFTIGIFFIGYVKDIFKILRGKFTDSRGMYLLE